MITGDHADGTDKWTDANATEDQDIDLSIFQTKPRRQQEEEQAWTYLSIHSLLNMHIFLHIWTWL